MLDQAPGRTCGPTESCLRWSRFAGRTCDPVGDPHWSSLFLKDCTLWEGPMLERFMDDCLQWMRPHSPLLLQCEEEGAAETTCDELTTTPHSPSPCTAWEWGWKACGSGGVEKLGVKLSLGRKGGVGGKCF